MLHGMHRASEHNIITQLAAPRSDGRLCQLHAGCMPRKRGRLGGLRYVDVSCRCCARIPVICMCGSYEHVVFDVELSRFKGDSWPIHRSCALSLQHAYTYFHHSKGAYTCQSTCRTTDITFSGGPCAAMPGLNVYELKSSLTAMDYSLCP